MGKTVLFILGLVLFLGGVGYEIYKGQNSNLGINIKTFKSASSSGLARQYPLTIKAVLLSNPGLEMTTLKRDSKEIKAFGINTVQIIISGKKEKDGHFYPQIGPFKGKALLNYYENVIAEIKRDGFAVWISYDVSSGGVNWPTDLIFKNRNQWEKDAKESTAQFGKIFEEYQVEYYSPVVEFDTVLIKNNITGHSLNIALAGLSQAVYPEVSAVFNGKLIAKVSERRLVSAPEMESEWLEEARGADIVALDFFPRYQGGGDYEFRLKEELQAVTSVSQKLIMPWMFGEYEVKGGGRVEALSIISNEFLNSQPKPIGFSFNLWKDIEDETNKTVKEALKKIYQQF